MTEAYASSRQSHNAIRVAAPRVGDLLSGALHAAYDRVGEPSDDFAILLAKLDRIDCRAN